MRAGQISHFESEFTIWCQELRLLIWAASYIKILHIYNPTYLSEQLLNLESYEHHLSIIMSRVILEMTHFSYSKRSLVLLVFVKLRFNPIILLKYSNTKFFICTTKNIDYSKLSSKQIGHKNHQVWIKRAEFFGKTTG